MSSLKTKVLNTYQLDKASICSIAINETQLISLVYCADKSYRLHCIENGNVIDLNFPVEPIFNTIHPNIGLFIYEKGFGCVLDNSVAFWKDVFGSPQVLDIKNPFPPDWARRVTGAKRACYDISTNRVFVLCNSYGNSNGEYVAILESRDSHAEYSDIRIDLLDYEKKVEITDLAINNNELYLHSVGYPHNYGKWGMDYSLLWKSNGERLNIEIEEVEHGCGLFSSDSKYLIVRELNPPKTLYFYDLDTFEIKSINITPKKVLGGVKKWFSEFDMFGNTLWLLDGWGNVTELEVIGI